MSEEDSLIHLIHTVWSAGLTALLALLGGIVKWNWTRLADRVEQIAGLHEDKADKNEVTQMGDRLAKLIGDMDTRAQADRTRMANDIQLLVGKVGMIEGKLSRRN